MKRATKAPPRIRETTAAGLLEEIGTRLVRTRSGIIVVGEVAHELPREDINAAYSGRILVEPEPIYEVLS